MPIKARGDKDQIGMKLLHETQGQIWISSVEPNQNTTLWKLNWLLWTDYYELIIRNWLLWIDSYELIIMNWLLRINYYELIIMNCLLWIDYYELMLPQFEHV